MGRDHSTKRGAFILLLGEAYAIGGAPPVRTFRPTKPSSCLPPKRTQYAWQSRARRAVMPVSAQLTSRRIRPKTRPHPRAEEGEDEATAATRRFRAALTGGAPTSNLHFERGRHLEARRRRIFVGAAMSSHATAGPCRARSQVVPAAHLEHEGGSELASHAASASTDNATAVTPTLRQLRLDTSSVRPVPGALALVAMAVCCTSRGADARASAQPHVPQAGLVHHRPNAGLTKDRHSLSSAGIQLGTQQHAWRAHARPTCLQTQATSGQRPRSGVRRAEGGSRRDVDRPAMCTAIICIDSLPDVW